MPGQVRRECWSVQGIGELDTIVGEEMALSPKSPVRRRTEKTLQD